MFSIHKFQVNFFGTNTFSIFEALKEDEEKKEARNAKFCKRNEKPRREYLELDRRTRYFYDFIVAHALLSLLDFVKKQKHT
jgi:hypothetical protein